MDGLAEGVDAMPEFLDFSADKFTFRVAVGRLYTAEGLWLDSEAPNRVRVGFSDYVQQHSGDVAFLTVKPPGTRLQAGEEFAELETVKVNQGVPIPISGTVLEANEALELTPEIVNRDPYGEGWLAVLEPASWEQDRVKLLDARAYLSMVQAEVEKELEKP